MNSLHSFSLSAQPLADIYTENHNIHNYNSRMTQPIQKKTITERSNKHHNFQGFSYHSRRNEDSRKDINHEKKVRKKKMSEEKDIREVPR